LHRWRLKNLQSWLIGGLFQRMLRVVFISAAEPVRASSSAVECPIRCGQRMTIGAEESQIVRVIVSPISIDVLDFNGNLACHGMALSPIAFTASLSYFVNQVAPYESRAIKHSAILARLQHPASEFEEIVVFAFKRTITSGAFLDFVAASVQAPPAKLFRIHASMLQFRYAIRMAR